jgi:putative Mn2+ efflux pump MntP
MALGFALGLDSLRVSIGLGAVKQNRVLQFRLALAFGVFDAVMPLIGLLLGHSLLSLTGSGIEYLGPICLATYGLYILYVSRLSKMQKANADEIWIVFGLPLSLSLDNLATGMGLGLLDFPPVASAAVLGFISGLMAWVGLQMGKILIEKFPMREDLIVGVTFILVAVSLTIDLL